MSAAAYAARLLALHPLRLDTGVSVSLVVATLLIITTGNESISILSGAHCSLILRFIALLLCRLTFA
jgi:hypothetical protein